MRLNMKCMTFEQQVAAHIQFLEQAGLKLNNLIIDSADFVRSLAQGEVGRGEYAYKTVSRQLINGMTGLITWYRGEGGRISTYKTYGQATQCSDTGIIMGSSQNICLRVSEKEECVDVNMKRIQKFWDLSSVYGESEYLKRKGVKAHRIRFRENQYGKVAVVPMIDTQEQLRGYQILNANGSKLFAKGIRVSGLFHPLIDLKDGVAIGIAESYVTAATCFELLPMPTVTTFTSENLEHVAGALRERYPNSPLVIFADNDRHLLENKGMNCAKKALARTQGNGIILAPEFKGHLKTRALSDWNDLVRESGPVYASKQIWKALQSVQDDRIKTFYF